MSPERVPVEPPLMAEHPIALALKGIFNDDDHARDQAERDALSPQLRARYKRINEFCGALLKRQRAFDYKRNDRDDELWGLCDWDRMTCGNGDPGAHRVIIEQHDEKTAKAIVVKSGERRVPVRLAMLDRWRVVEIDCGRDTILTTSGLLNEDVADPGLLDAGQP